MAAKSNQRNLRIPESHITYVTQDGERMKYPSLMGNVPRVSGIRTGGDKEFLASNNGKLSKLQHNFS